MWPQSSPAAQSRPYACPQATGRLKGNALGPVRLGMSRARVRRAFAHSARYSGGGVDLFCLRPAGIRVAYVQGKAALAVSANRHYALRGAKPGARFTPRLARRIHAARLAHTQWYLVPNGRSVGVLRVGRGVVKQVGIAGKSLTANRAALRRLLGRV
jgi:hypothetical protein